jgi:micrococcal nuclease
MVYRIPANMKRIVALSGRVAEMTPAVVERIVDGDTIVVSFFKASGLGEKEKVRLIGVDTPETVDPRRPVEYFGKEASGFVMEHLLDRRVRLAFEPTLRDYYDRLLAYVFLEDGSCFNLTIIAEGYGHAYTKYPFMFMDDFRAAEREAREGKRGLWGL